MVGKVSLIKKEVDFTGFRRQVSASSTKLLDPPLSQKTLCPVIVRCFSKVIEHLYLKAEAQLSAENLSSDFGLAQSSCLSLRRAQYAHGSFGSSRE